MPNRCFALFLLLAAPLLIKAQMQTPEKVPRAKPDYSQEAVVVEQAILKLKFENDGTSVQENSARVRVQSDAGVQHFGLLAFSYESGTGSLDIEYVRVRKPDGTVIDTPPENIQDMPSEITRSAPFYSDLHEKHVAVKGLSVGDVLEYKYVARVTKPLIPSQFWTYITFPHDNITLQNQLEVSVPRERAIKFKSADPQPAISENGSYRVYTWSLNVLSHPVKNEKVEIAQNTWEQARGRFPQPDAQLTSFSSWEELGRWYRDIQADRVKPAPEITAKAAELTKGLTDDDAKLRAIYHYVSTQFRYIGVAFGIGRYQPHFAAEVLNNQYGDCKDKHTLLASLLLASGFQAYPALINSERDLDPDIPSPSQFNHVITAIPRGNSMLWLDATGEVAPFQFLLAPLRDKHALLVFNDKPASLVVTPAEVPYPFSDNFQMDASLDDHGTLTGNAQLLTRGDLEFLLRSAFRATPMPQWKELAQNVSALLGFGGEVSDVTISSPEKTDELFRMSYKYTRKEYGDWDNRRIVAPSAFVALPQVTLAADPQEPQTRRLYAGYLVSQSKFDEAVPIWQAYIKLQPDDFDGPAALASALSHLQRYDEPAQAMEAAVKLNPNSATFQLRLATAYLNAGNTQKADAAGRQLLELASQPRILNQAAYEMALAKTTPPIALEIAQQAVKATEDSSNDIDLDSQADIPFNEDLTLTLAYHWATLGFVHQRLGHSKDAEKFLLAAWKLSQTGVAAAHLCELYIDQHNTQSALHMCRLARSRLPLENDPFTYHLPELIAQNDARLEKLSPGSSKTYDSHIVDDILAMRDFKMPPVVQGVANAEFLVLLQYDPQLGAFKVTDTKFVSGSPKLKSGGKSLTKLNFNFSSPDGNEVTFVRRGTFLCGAACEFILPDPTNSRNGTLQIAH